MQLFREPLLHFAVAGAIIFGGYSWLNSVRVESTALEPVRVGEGDVRWLKQVWSSQWLRQPTAEELKGLVDNLLNEKLLARESEAMGLGVDDIVIRRRLAQKLKFLVEDTIQLAEPSEAELRQFFAANASRFETPGRLSFRQVYFDPGQRKAAAADAKAALAGLNANTQDGQTGGDRLLFGDSFENTDELAVSAMFGADFAHEVFALEPGEWRGPLKSGYGYHVVLITQRSAPALKPFEIARNAVLTEWRGRKQAELNRDYLAELRKKYRVELDDGAKVALGFEQTPSVAAK